MPSRHSGSSAAASVGAAASPTPIADLSHVRFDRALEELQDVDPRARVALDTGSGLAKGVDGNFPMPMPTAARSLPGSDRAAAAAVLFLDHYGALFGIPGWHALRPISASPLGRSIWFAFEARTPGGTLEAHVCADEDVVKHVRIQR
jgi:hypothetical protein